MKFATIEPRWKKLIMVDAFDVYDAARTVGLNRNQMDHGTIIVYDDWYSVNCFVYEFGLYVPAEKQHYFGMNGELYAGNAVLYGAQNEDTVDLIENRIPPLIWFNSITEIEAAIQNEIIRRPIFAINNVQFWQWPDPPTHMDPEDLK